MRRFFRIAAELVFSFFYPPICGGNRRECGGNRRECGGNSRKANVAAFLFWLRRFFWFAADFLECGGNFRRNALRQKFPPQEVLGVYINRKKGPPPNKNIYMVRFLLDPTNFMPQNRQRTSSAIHRVLSLPGKSTVPPFKQHPTVCPSAVARPCRQCTCSACWHLDHLPSQALSEFEGNPDNLGGWGGGSKRRTCCGWFEKGKQAVLGLLNLEEHKAVFIMSTQTLSNVQTKG